MNWFSRLKEGLKRSSDKLTQGISQIVKKRTLDDEVLEELEELLISADLGVRSSALLIQRLSKERFNQEISEEEVKTFLAQEIQKILDPVASPLELSPAKKPFVVLMVGVNGSGKTTTIGKLGKYWQEQGKKVAFAAGDTFRAAAVEQLEIWGKRLNIPVFKAPAETDPASLAFEALKASQERQDDLLLIDTAGRLHNKESLMAELEKIRRVLQKLDPSCPHSCLLVLDASTGQNALSQVEIFKETVQLNGLIVTKLDGTARGGILVSLAEKFHLPIHAIGVGEQAEDLRPFNAEEFANNLLGLNEHGKKA